MHNLGIVNPKGGVAKTTSCVNIAAVLAERGKRVLVVDLDPQGGLTISLGFNPDEYNQTIYHVLLEQIPLEKMIIPTNISNVDLAVTNLDLAGIEAASREIGWEYILKDALATVAESYDYTLLDCPPYLGRLLSNALIASHLILIPLQCEELAFRALKLTNRFITKIRQRANPHVKVRILRTMYSSKTKHSQQVSQQVKRIGGDAVLDAVIKRTVKVANAMAARQPIIQFAESSDVASAYRQAVHEIMEVMNHDNQTTGD